MEIDSNRGSVRIVSPSAPGRMTRIVFLNFVPVLSYWSPGLQSVLRLGTMKGETISPSKPFAVREGAFGAVLQCSLPSGEGVSESTFGLSFLVFRAL